ncbi:MAG: hemolysin family protein [Alphaproteobacteria bacterium]|nr:hemolysin family protein [Alphaproteobacteria bacterium]MDE2340402.1 HlyC/CorC family transporter [Alphaproteobacteria bacterium]
MPDDGSGESKSDSRGRLWHGLKAMLFGEPETTLRDQIEDVIDEHEGDGAPPLKGDLSPVERQMLRNLLALGDKRVDDVKVPRADIVAVPETISFTDLVAAFAEAAHSRLPVYEGSLDQIIGMVHVKDVLALVRKAGTPPIGIAPLIRQPLFVPQAMGVLDLLGLMRQKRVHLAIVIDEYSGTEGLVTIEDLVEEIVGEIEDEHDDAPEASFVRCGDHWEADARAPLAEVAQMIDARLGIVDEDVDTLGGLAFVLAGHVPQVGEVVAHPSGWRLEITEGDARRVMRMRLHGPRHSHTTRDTPGP